jgi:hypothetical protein
LHRTGAESDRNVRTVGHSKYHRPNYYGTRILCCRPHVKHQHKRSIVANHHNILDLLFAFLPRGQRPARLREDGEPALDEPKLLGDAVVVDLGAGP